MSTGLSYGQFTTVPPVFGENSNVPLQATAQGYLYVATAAGSPLVIAEAMPPDYETVAAGQTDQVLGGVGAVGDFITALQVVVVTPATAEVSIQDGAGSSFVVFPADPGGGVGSYNVPIGIKSTAGAWSVTTGAGASVVATGYFT